MPEETSGPKSNGLALRLWFAMLLIYVVPAVASVLGTIFVSPLVLLTLPIAFLRLLMFVAGQFDRDPNRVACHERAKTVVSALCADAARPEPLLSCGSMPIGTVYCNGRPMITIGSRLVSELTDEQLTALLRHELEHAADPRWMSFARSLYFVSQAVSLVIAVGVGFCFSWPKGGFVVMASAPTVAWLVSTAVSLPKSAFRRKAEFAADNGAVASGIDRQVMLESLEILDRTYKARKGRIKYLPGRLYSVIESWPFHGLSEERVRQLGGDNGQDLNLT